eukprot:1194650-Prorocentrum_minimum.AAC.1
MLRLRPTYCGQVWQGQDGSNSCVPCAVNQYKEHASAEPCTPCPPFSRLLREGAASVHDCQCEEGMYIARGYSSRGNTSSMECQECPAGGICTAGRPMGLRHGFWRRNASDHTIYTCKRP